MRRSAVVILATLSLVGCQDDPKGDGPPDELLQSPLAEILSHLPGDNVTEGVVAEFAGAAEDPDTDLSALEAAFWFDGIEACGWTAVATDGGVDCAFLVPPLDQLSSALVDLDLEVRDPEGGIGSVSITLGVEGSDAPVVTILTPDHDAVTYSDVELELRGQASDDIDAPTELVGTWESDLDGVLESAPLDESGEVGAWVVGLTAGEHVLTLSVEDTVGHIGSDSVTIEVFDTNTAPSCAILSPESNAAIQPGELASFEVQVDDAEDGAEGLPVTLSSDLAGELASLTAASSGHAIIDVDDLPEGTHVITLATEDAPGLSCEDSITFTVGTPPSLVLTSPLDGDVVNEDEQASFEGTASDVPSDPDSLTFSWVSSLDGEFSTAGADSAGLVDFDVSGLTIGTHLVTVTVTDPDGMYAVQSFGLVINGLPGAAELSISPDPAGTEDELVANVDVDSPDPEGDTITYSYAWTVDGVASSASSTAVLPASATTRGEVWQVTVTPDDGHGIGASASSDLTISNTPPVLADVTLSPSDAQEGDTLVCTPGTATDADGDTVTFSYAWTVAGSTVSATSSTLDDSFWGRSDVVACTVTPNDGFEDGAPVASGSVTIQNTAPEIGSVTISPSAAGVGDTLTCSYSGYSDADGDSDSSTFAWLVDGTTVGTSSTLSGAFAKDDTVTCQVTPSDGTDAGTPLTDSIVIDNTPPGITGVSISPSAPMVDDTLTCSYAGFSDADGDADVSTYSWTVAGTEVGTGSTLSGAFVKDDTVTCTVTPHDGTDAGTAASASVTVDNTAPVLADVSLSPSDAVEGDTLTCTPGTASDADGDTVTYTYAWSVAGSSISATSSTLDDTFWDKGDAVFCSVTPDDGTDSGTAVASNTVTIGNTPPELSSASISPASPVVSDSLTCSPGTASDVDGDTVSYSYEWRVGGTVVGTSSTLSSGFVKGDAVTCTITPDDGTDDGDSVEDTVSVGNSAPSVTSVSIAPTSPQVDDTLTCSATASDDDGDTVTFTYSWSISGTEVGTSSTLSGAFASGDAVTCTVTPDDGTDTGASLASSAITIQNTAPVMSSVTLSPSTAYEADTLTCAPVATDADGDAVTYTYAWSVDGSTVSATSSTLSGSFFDKDEDVVCTVTPDDGTDSGSSMDSSALTISNTAPSVSSVSVSPSGPTVSDTLSCSYSGFSDDDGDTDQSTYSWTISGTEVGTSSTLSAGFSAGDTVTCTVTPDDGTDTGTAVSDSVTIENTAPSIASVSISPTAPQVDDTLTCSYSGFSDDDGDSDQSTYSWTISGTEVGTTSTLSSGHARGDTVTCTVTPYDGTDAGTAVSDSVTIDNTAPVMVSVSLSPTTAAEGDTLACTPSATDADGDTVTYSYAWTVDGSAVSPTSSTLSDSYWDRDEDVVCTVTPSDGTDSGTSMASNTVTIDNSAPSISSVSISPTTAQIGDTLTCSYSGFSDADGDADSSTYSWTISGTEVGTSSTLSSGYAAGDTVTCTVTPDDGTDTGTAVSDSLTIDNTAPVMVSVTISPSAPTVSDTLTCTPSATDADGDTVTYTYDWTISGTTVGTSSTLSSGYSKTDSVRCTVTPNDGTEDGSSDYDETTILNSAPTVSSVTLSPSSPVYASTLTASYTGSDVDGDSLSYSHAWYVNGSLVSGSTSLAVSGFAVKGDSIYVTVTASDGSASGSDSSSTVTVGNTAPSAPTVSVTPTSPTDADTLTCSASSSDVDGDTVTYTYDWTVGGTTVGTAATLSSGFSGGDTVTCTVVASDGTDDSGSGSDAVAITPSSTCTASTCPADLAVGDLLVTEIMTNPSAVGDSSGEWFEVYNHSGVTVGIGDLVLSDDSGSHTVSSSATVAADDYVVFCINSDSATNGGVTCDYEYSGLSLSDSDVVTLSYGGLTFDEVDFSTWTVGPSAGSAFALAFGEQVFDDLDNDTEDYWCDSSTVMSGGDYGSPGAGNDDECGSVASSGNTVAGASYSCCASNYLVAYSITIPNSGVLVDFNPHSLYLGYNDVALGLYEDSGGAPGDLVAEVQTVVEGNLSGTSLTAAWWEVEPDGGPIWVTAGTYWIASNGNFTGAAGNFITHDTSRPTTMHYVPHTFGTVLPDPFGSVGSFSVWETDIHVDVVEF